MEVISFLTFLIVVILFIIVLSHNSRLNSDIDQLSIDINHLKALIQKLGQPAEPPKPEVKPEPKVTEPLRTTLVKEEALKASITEEKKTIITQPQPEPVKAVPPVTKPQPAPEPKKPKVSSDFEKFIGENLISKIGIIILVLGVGFFVKYAIDQNWINEYGRTAIGLLAGTALIGIAHYIRKSYKTFSSLLTGGGIAVFYLTIAIAFHQYHLFSQTVAFVLLVVVTIFSVYLSLLYDKKELAIFSQIGGYAAPFMVSTGEGNYIVLFTYMLILGAGLIALAYFKRWHILNLLAFIFTVIIYSGWLGSTFWKDGNLPIAGALIFASLFYLVFFLVNALNNLRERKPFNGIEIGMILSNNLFFLLSGLAILHSYHEGIYKGLFTIIIGLYNFGWVLLLYHKKQVDKNFIFLLIGLVMSFISISIPIQLNGHSITLFWSAEFVILLWLAQKSGIKILKAGHLVVLVLTVISLIMDWNNLYGYYRQIPLNIVFNQAFVTGFVALTALVLSDYFLKNETDEFFIRRFISVKSYKTLLAFLVGFAAYLVPFLELEYQMNNYYNLDCFRHVVYGIFNYAYLIVLLYIIRRKGWELALSWFYYIAAASLFIYLIYYNIMVLETRDAYFYGQYASMGNFLFHYLTLPILGGIVWLICKEKAIIKPQFLSKAFYWYVTFFVIFVLSAELDNLLLLSFNASHESMYSILKISHKVGYPILWAIGAFVLILWGIRSKVKDYRIIALSLIGLILLKLFLIDVWSMSEGGRIAAFIFLGIVLLVISFLYQKLKKFLLEDESKKSNSETL
jgi:Predicted membrane protein